METRSRASKRTAALQRPRASPREQATSLCIKRRFVRYQKPRGRDCRRNAPKNREAPAKRGATAYTGRSASKLPHAACNIRDTRRESPPLLLAANFGDPSLQLKSGRHRATRELPKNDPVLAGLPSLSCSALGRATPDTLLQHLRTTFSGAPVSTWGGSLQRESKRRPMVQRPVAEGLS